MSLMELVTLTLLITPSGALSPGPLTASTLALGTREGWRAGILVAVGHTLVEFPYIILLYYALSTITSLLRGSIGLILGLGAASIVLYFGFLLLRDFLSGNIDIKPGRFYRLHPILIGVLLTGFNVFFLLWWIGVGLPLIRAAIPWGLAGIAIMYVSHVWMDYVWLGLIALAGYKGARSFGSKGYRLLLGVLGAILVFFGVDIAINTLEEFL